ncbi:MAG TPA: nuclear transport factor 2 family protein [Gemmatimonadales bacterium]|jgi:hypothetical protein
MTTTKLPRASVASAAGALLVERLYGAFARKDIEAVLDAVSDDVVWSEPENPWNPAAGTHRGRAGVAAWLRIGKENEEVIELLPREFIAKGDMVIVIGHMTCRARPTGRIYESDFVHVIQVEGGQICRFQEFFDTWAAGEAFRPRLEHPFQDLSEATMAG